MDKQVARQDSPLVKLLDRFVCVRIVQSWGLDLSLFQFDSDLTMTTFFLEPDGTILGRYGSRASREEIHDVSLVGFRKAAEAALALHEAFPENKNALQAKTGPKPKWATPEKIPNLPGKVVEADGSRAGCIHCHAINTGQLLTLRKQGEPVPDRLLWRFPMPRTVGMMLDPKTVATVTEVAGDSAASTAGIEVGDEIVSVAGQPVISIADVQWVLQNAKVPTKLALEVNRKGKRVPLSLELKEGWRRSADFGWRSHAWPLRFQKVGFKSVELPEARRRQMKLPAVTLALQIERLAPGFVKNRNAAAQRVGLRNNDVIVAVDGKTTPMRECDFLAFVIQQKKPGDKVELTVRRGSLELKVNLPVQ